MAAVTAVTGVGADPLCCNAESNVTVANVPSALFRCTSYAAPSASVTTRRTVAPGTAFNFIAFNVPHLRTGHLRLVAPVTMAASLENRKNAGVTVMNDREPIDDVQEGY